MKKLALMIIAAGLFFAACSTSKNTDSTTDSTTTDTTATDTTRMERPS